MDFTNWKCNASSSGKLMTKVATEFTEEQLSTYKDLHLKYTSGIKMTKTNTNKYLSLAKKINGVPELSQTAKSLLDLKYKECVFGRKSEIASKYLKKGLDREDEAISLYCDVTGDFVVKNEERFYNSHFQGTPDIISNTIKDIKNSWTFKTFPLTSDVLPDKDYWWQMQLYMDLTGLKTKAQIIYCLLSQTVELMDDELSRLNYKHAIFGVDREIAVDNPSHIRLIIDLIQEMIITEEDLINYCNRSRFHIELEWFDNFKEVNKNHRIRIFEVEYNEEAVNKAKQQVENAREYLNNITIRLGSMI